MVTSLPSGYTILVRSHAKCYSILTRASKRIQLITRKENKQKKGDEFQNNVASPLFHVNQNTVKSPPAVPRLALEPTAAR